MFFFFFLAGEWDGVEVGRVHQGGNAALITTLLALRSVRFKITIPDQVKTTIRTAGSLNSFKVVTESPLGSRPTR